MSADKAKSALDAMDPGLHNAQITDEQLDRVLNDPQKANRKMINKPIVLDRTQKMQCVDGCFALTDSVYRMSDSAFIFPITPASLMSEYADQWSSSDRKNVFGQVTQVTQMNSEAGAAGALHGALVTGSLATTFTASQGLLLMIPNMYKIAGEMLPCVLHVGARAIAGQALSIYGDHTDVMSARATGFAILASNSVQEGHDMAIIAGCATLEMKIPILHFEDGFRTTHEIKKVHLVEDDLIDSLIPQEALTEHRNRGLNPLHPDQRGTAQGPDIYMQMLELANTHYDNAPRILQKHMDAFYEKTGRRYELFTYYGAEDATHVVVIMGSGFFVCHDYISTVRASTAVSAEEKKIGVLGVHLFSPWSADAFLEKLPTTVTHVSVLDKTKEHGSQGEPLFCQVATTLMTGGRLLQMFGGRYGLGSKDFSPKQCGAVFANMRESDIKKMKRKFTVGITDDVTNLSLEVRPDTRNLQWFPSDVVQCVFWGFGSDGTVSGNKATIKIIGDYAKNTEVQGYFEYDAKKSGGLTISFLRFCVNKCQETGADLEKPYKIEAPYKIGEAEADFVACHNETYVESHKYHVTKFLRGNGKGTLLLNTCAAVVKDDRELLDVLSKTVSPKVLYDIARKKCEFYVMDASGIAKRFGLNGKINMLCVQAFFQLSKVLPIDKAIEILCKNVRKQFSHKGDLVIQQNLDIINALAEDPTIVRRVHFLDHEDIVKAWSNPLNTLKDGRAGILAELYGENKKIKSSTKSRAVVDMEDLAMSKFVDEVMDPVNKFEGFDIKTSTLLENKMLGGVMPAGTAQYEKRNPNPTGRVPKWNSKACTQCNKCAMICPHGVVRPYLVPSEKAEEYLPHVDLADLTKTKGGNEKTSTMKYSIQVSVLDCTGCNACAQVCPEEGALVMTDIQDLMVRDPAGAGTSKSKAKKETITQSGGNAKEVLPSGADKIQEKKDEGSPSAERDEKRGHDKGSPSAECDEKRGNDKVLPSGASGAAKIEEITAEVSTDEGSNPSDESDEDDAEKTIWQKMVENWKGFQKVPEFGEVWDEFWSVKGAMFQKPLMEFSGACSGCGETPYVKLLTQLFRERLVIANATGCSSIWGSSFPTNPYTVNSKGRGPAWGNSLFEDNAEYGLGMFKARITRRDRCKLLIEKYSEKFLQNLADDQDEKFGLVDVEDYKSSDGKSAWFEQLRDVFADWLQNWKVKGELTMALYDIMEPVIKQILKKYSFPGAPAERAPVVCELKEIFDQLDQVPHVSQWIVGGDGWAFDIGYGGLDHVMADSRNDVNFLILDTEMYSNTGGQASKSTPISAQVKFAMGGKQQKKKDIGRILMSYEHVYVASVCMANMTQLVQSMKEADEYDGPSFIQCYSPCIEHGIRPNGLNDLVNEITLAVESGYWPLYRYNPRIRERNENLKPGEKWQSPFTLDSKKLKTDLVNFLRCEARFINLQKRSPQMAEELHIRMNRDIKDRMSRFKMFEKVGPNPSSAVSGSGGGSDNERVVYVCYGSATGNAQRLAENFAGKLEKCKLTGAFKEKTLAVRCEPLEAIELPELLQSAESTGKPVTLVILLATCGQGATPDNALTLCKDIKKLDGGDDALKGKIEYTLFGLGDSSYFFFCQAARDMDKLLSEKGASNLYTTGTGDESSAGGNEQAFEQWLDSDKFWQGIQVEKPLEEGQKFEQLGALTVSQNIMLDSGAEKSYLQKFYERNFGSKVKPIKLVENRKLTTCDTYGKEAKRDFRHYVFDTTGEHEKAMEYAIGDSMQVYPQNDGAEVDGFIAKYKSLSEAGLEARTVVNVQGHPTIPDGETTLAMLFGALLDLFGKPQKKFFQDLLSIFESSFPSFYPEPAEAFEQVRALLHSLAFNTNDAYGKFANAFQGSYSVADALLLLQDAAGSALQLPLPVLISIIPVLKPRAYSIASAPAYHGANIVELCILTYEWDGAELPESVSKYVERSASPQPKTRLRPGLCTSYLRGCEAGCEVFCAIKPAAMDAPKVTDDIMCAGIGSGVAPLLGYLYDRVAAAKSGAVKPEELGQLVLYFGNRFEQFEYLYKEELLELEKTYSWFTFRTAFSNLGRDEEAAYARKYKDWFTAGIHEAFPDGGKTPYVQHVVETDEKATEVLLRNDKGLLYQCGNRGLPKGVQWALTSNFEKVGGLGASDAQNAMENLFIEGRAQQEVW